MLKIALITVGSVFVLAYILYAIYIIFFPLTRTIVGGLQIFRMYGFKRSEDPYLTPDLELGLTMADGGEKTKKKQTGQKKQTDLR